jgi:hypothetical protein
MAYRQVYENLKNDSLVLPYNKIVFCGFNALSVCEEHIFKTIEQQYETEFWWDADEHFLHNKLHEAGNFLRDYQRKFYGKNHHWIIDNFLKRNKNIDIVGVSSTIGQTKFVSQTVKRDTLLETNAIVLCDEQLLIPLIYTIDTDNVNITMGYSISQSELYLFVDILLRYFCNARINDDKVEFYNKDIAAVLQHSYLFGKINDQHKLENILPYFIPYMPMEILKEYFPNELVKLNETTESILEQLVLIIQSLQIEDAYFVPVKDVLIQQLQILMQSLNNKTIFIDRTALPFVVKQFLATIKIPFVSLNQKNENPIQIMGFLESRILDFDNLFILSLNDDHLPGTNKTNSFIPYNLRKGFGLPTFEQFDGINAYHFYRLLKRAKNIHLIYNNQVGENNSEKSRFIRQILHDLDTKENNIQEYIAVLNEDSIVNTNIDLLHIFKTPEMISDLRERIFSASSLKIYMHCPVQFYLKYVTKIDEPNELLEEIDAAVFGEILHKTLELIYQPYLSVLLDKQKIMLFGADGFIDKKIKQACEILELPKEILFGSNRLQLTIIEKIIIKIIENDVQQNGLYILKTEEKFIWQNLKLEDGTFASIQGTIDRIDKMSDNAVRIIDYKTGKIELPKFPDINMDAEVDLFLDKLFIFDQKDYSASFQGMLYALIYYKLYNCNEIYVAFHHAKKMKDGLSYLNNQEPIPIELLLMFEERLSKLISNIVYKEPCFIQTENKNAYEYSVYADLLGLEM